MLFVGYSYGQSMFGPIPKKNSATFNPHAKSVVTPFDTVSGSSYVGFRFTGPTIMYGTSFTNLKEADLYTFLGIDYEKATWDANSQKYYTNWAVGLHGGAGGQFAPNSVSGVTAGAITISTQRLFGAILPFKATIGFVYNFTTKTGQPAVGPGIPLNN